MSLQQNPILVTGATGKQGGATARRLLADGIAVRALVRDPQTPAARALADAGAELVTGDFDTPATLDTAVAGARGVFLVPPAAFGPNGWQAELEATRGVVAIDAAKRAGVEQIVFTGVASMTDDAAWGQAGKRGIEAAAAASGMRYTLLRPVRFMENYIMRGSPVDGIIDGVHKHLFPAEWPLQMIAIDDIAAFAALAFADPDRFHGRTLELAGDAITPVAALAAITRATGYPVRYHEVTEAEADAIGEQIGNTWRLLRKSAGWHADIPALREIYPALTTLESWLSTTGAAKIKAQQDSDRRAAAH
ncbi:NmrA family NAD(P)-binding protein [Nocardia pseudovaccinii]|uniref:NmrA family NAD(P)-binding protein n=1 Tax=Nocardia pseudovaccinii TaxID=189540 RepID=UPI0007A3AD75|nr:NmrA family NAD(P)-binding protein [Nocardia pseudovaccinii]